MPPEEQLFKLIFIGCKPSLIPKNIAFEIFRPAIQKLVEDGYLQDVPYGIDDKLSTEYFIFRDGATREFVDNLLNEPRKNVIVCAWFDHAYADGERLIEADIPVSYLVFHGVVTTYFSEGKPKNVIPLSDNWEQAKKDFVDIIANQIDNLRAS